MRVFEDMMVRRIFQSEREEERSDWRKMHNEELHTLYSTHRLILLIKLRNTNIMIWDIIHRLVFI
jgi:hypothetical protein